MKNCIKHIVLILLVVCLVTGCNKNNNNNNDDIDVNENLNNDNNQSNDSSNDNNSTLEKIDPSKIKRGYVFSEGKAWVRCSEIGDPDYDLLYCINKNCEILFTAKQSTCVDPLPFYNGISVISYGYNANNKCYTKICDEKGNITEAEDLGATEILIYSEDGSFELLKKGYFIAKKVETTFSSSIEKYAVFNIKMENITGYVDAEKIPLLIEDFWYNGPGISSGGYKGYLSTKISDGYYDSLYTITEFEEIATSKKISVNEFLNTVGLDFVSDMWEYNYHDECYYDMLSPTHKMTIDLSQYSSTIDNIYDFENGYAPITFNSNNQHFFTILKEDGSFCFEPINGNFKCFKDEIIVYQVDNKLISIDINGGKVGETFFEEPDNMFGYYNISLNDGVIVYYDLDLTKYYSLDFKPLF